MGPLVLISPSVILLTVVMGQGMGSVDCFDPSGFVKLLGGLVNTRNAIN